jgi:hypothetical protein
MGGGSREHGHVRQLVINKIYEGSRVISFLLWESRFCMIVIGQVDNVVSLSS